MIKFGFEKEYFIEQKHELVLVPDGMPQDECGYLAEARGEPHHDPMCAAFLLLAVEEKLKRLGKARKVKLLNINWHELDPEFSRRAVRRFGKHSVPHERGNLYGYDYPIEKQIIGRAGLHVHFSDTQEMRDKEGRLLFTGCLMMNMPRIIQALDQAFADEIKEARRIPGFYEMKSHGWEYRSLPASVDVRRVAEVLNSRITVGFDSN